MVAQIGPVGVLPNFFFVVQGWICASHAPAPLIPKLQPPGMRATEMLASSCPKDANSSIVESFQSMSQTTNYDSKSSLFLNQWVDFQKLNGYGFLSVARIQNPP